MASRDEQEEAYHALCAYTLEHGRRDPTFVHQHVVDAYAAQHLDSGSKPIGIVFSLVGLYLHVERGFTGKQVQHVHMRLARHKQPWPTLPLPPDRGSLKATDVMTAPAGRERDRAIDVWCTSVWRAFASTEWREGLVDLLRRNAIDTGDEPR